MLVGSVACARPSAARAGDAAGNAASALNRRLDRIGIQLYTVRREMRQDFDGTLARLADFGFREVEFAGYFGRTPAQVRDVLRRLNLAAPSTHIGFDQLGDAWDRVLDDAAAIGHRYVTVPWLPTEPRGSVDGWQRVAVAFNRAGERAKARGLKFAYHNHDFEFARIGDVVPYDLLLAETDPSLVEFQMDVFWLVKGGGDPLEYLRKHPGRFTTLHVKDSSGPPNHAQVNIGDGMIDFAAILRLDRAQRQVVRHVFVEHDQPADAMAFARDAFGYLSTMEI